MAKLSAFVITLAATFGSAAGFAPQRSGAAATASKTELGFFGKKKSPAVGKQSALTDEAVEIYLKQYPQGNDRKVLFFESWGMPAQSYSKEKDKKIFEVDDTTLRKAFNIAAGLYGEENALTMVKIQPGLLAYNSAYFSPSLDIYGEKFGVEEAKEMIIRNPGLLATGPAAAEAADDLTMQLSYVLQYTRPLGLAGPAILVSLASVPALEGFLGLERGGLLSSILN